METKLTVTAVQSNLLWEDKKRNFDQLEQQLISIDSSTDLIVLPEMFTTGFTMNPKPFAEPMDGQTIEWMKRQAQNKKAAILGSSIIEEDNAYFNRLLFVTEEAKVFYYDKRHTFTLAGENLMYNTGQNDGIVHFKGWKICLRICYDLRFPVWSRNTSDYDLLIYTANWPDKRINAWDTLLQARAIENMSYCIGVNRVGKDGSNLVYPGHTTIVDYMGICQGVTKENQPDTTTVSLDKEAMHLARKKLNFLNDRDLFSLQL